MSRNLEKRIETVRDVGDAIDDFIEGDKPDGSKMGGGEYTAMCQERGQVSVTIEIRAACGTKELSSLHDEFHIVLNLDKEADDKRILVGKLNNISSQVGALLKRWRADMR